MKKSILREIKDDVKRYLKLREKIFLLEGLIYSYSVDAVVNKLKKIGFNEIVIEDSFSGGKQILVKINGGNKIEEESKINKAINNVYGWSVGAYIGSHGNSISKKEYFEKDDVYYWLQYEPKFDIEVNENNYPPILFHITPEENAEKIIQKGLIPTSKNKKFSYSDRIFFSDKITEMTKLASMLVASRNEDIDHDSDEIISYVVFRIKIKSTAVPIKLIKDPNFENGYYSFESIPPRVILKTDKIT